MQLNCVHTLRFSVYNYVGGGNDGMFKNYTASKVHGLIFNLIVYSSAYLFSLIPFFHFDNIFMSELAFTVSATIIIYIISLFISDTSLYDPYWSVAPPIMLLLAMIRWDYWYINGTIIFIAVTIWSLRLTMNWINTYKGIGHEDWRYGDFRKKMKRIPFELLNFFGFMLMPTLVTYSGLTGAFFIISDSRSNISVYLGFLVMILGVILEHLADTAIHEFLKDNRGNGLTCREGIWKYSRHPNYLGEMTFWTGIYIACHSMYSNNWTRGLGFLLIIAVFIFASIPLMEAHNLANRKDYAEYMKETSVLIPMPPKGKEGETI